ncbi:hypothetical protein BC829DRAFT_418151 [Chytridium lagenaria]|nr:hypothetical protein BC829DRAFT_418151 [Chytridium lagenaria]
MGRDGDDGGGGRTREGNIKRHCDGSHVLVVVNEGRAMDRVGDEVGDDLFKATFIPREDGIVNGRVKLDVTSEETCSPHVTGPNTVNDGSRTINAGRDGCDGENVFFKVVPKGGDEDGDGEVRDTHSHHQDGWRGLKVCTREEMVEEVFSVIGVVFEKELLGKRRRRMGVETMEMASRRRFNLRVFLKVLVVACDSGFWYATLFGRCWSGAGDGCWIKGGAVGGGGKKWKRMKRKKIALEEEEFRRIVSAAEGKKEVVDDDEDASERALVVFCVNDDGGDGGDGGDDDDEEEVEDDDVDNVDGCGRVDDDGGDGGDGGRVCSSVMRISVVKW